MFFLSVRSPEQFGWRGYSNYLETLTVMNSRLGASELSQRAHCLKGSGMGEFTHLGCTTSQHFYFRLNVQTDVNNPIRLEIRLDLESTVVGAGKCLISRHNRRSGMLGKWARHHHSGFKNNTMIRVSVKIRDNKNVRGYAI